MSDTYSHYYSQVRALEQILTPGQRVLLTTHERSDGDGLGSEVALVRLLQTIGLYVEIWNPTPVPDAYRFLFAELHLREPDNEPPDDSFDLFFCIDASSLDRIGRVADYVHRQQWRSVMIDHHINPVSCADIILSDYRLASTGELVFRIMTDLKLPLTREIAEALWLAIYTDSGGFRYSNTRPVTLHTGAALLSTGIDVSTLYERIYFQRSHAMYRLLWRALQNMELLADGEAALMVLDRGMFAAADATEDDADEFTNFLLHLQGVNYGAFLYETSTGDTKISLRSRGSYRIHELARTLGGGGHSNAAGATLPGTLNENLSRFRTLLSHFIQHEKGSDDA